MVYISEDLNAATPPEQLTHILAASAGVLSRVDNSTSFGGYANFDTTNCFIYRAQLATCTLHASTSIMKLGLSLVKGLRFESSVEADAEEFTEWAERVNFFEQAQTLATLLPMNGTYLATYSGGPDNFKLTPLLMSTVTLLTDQVDTSGNAADILMPPVTGVVINESSRDPKSKTVLDPNNLIYGALLPHLHVQKDILGRETYGIYGFSLMDPLELNIRNLLKINKGYVSFVDKYGIGRLLINFVALQDKLKDGSLTVKQAQVAITDWMENHKNLKQNEDIVGVGIDAKPLDAAGILDVMPFKKSCETDIQVGLFQSPLSMGDSKGSTYAAGYVSEEDRMLVLESLQKVVRNTVQQAINKRLQLLGKTPGHVRVVTDELSTPKMEARDIAEWEAQGTITTDEARQWAGFSKKVQA